MENMTYEDAMEMRTDGCLACVYCGTGRVIGHQNRVRVCRKNAPTTNNDAVTFPVLDTGDWCGSFVRMPMKKD